MSHKPAAAASLTPDRVVSIARTYLGVPYKHQGRTLAGLDCVGFLKLIAHDLGIRPKDEYGYGVNVGQAKSEAIVRDHCNQVPRSQRQPGDLVLMHIDSEEPQHWAMSTDAGIIHACAKFPRQVVEHSLSEDLKRKIRKVYRLRGMTSV